MPTTSTRRLAVASATIFTTLLLVVAIYLLARNRWRAEIAASKLNSSGQKEILKTTVAMKWRYAGTMAPYFAAIDNGVNTNAGVEISLLQGGPTVPSIDQVLLGRAEFGITGAHDLAVARSKDQPLVSIAVIFRRSPTCIVSLEDSKILSPKDLEGKTIEITKGDNSEFEILAMLEKEGVKLPAANLPPFRYDYEALINRKINGAVAYENDQAITLSRTHRLNVIAPAQYGVTPYADVLFTTEEVIVDKPELVARVVDSFLSSWTWAFDNVDSCVELFLKSKEIEDLGLDKEIQKLVLHKSILFVKGDESSQAALDPSFAIGMQSPDRWRETIDLIKKYRSEPFQKTPDPGSCFTNRWVQLYHMRHKPSN
jgi:NitT/TauT family transport system substrate-binding protein